MECRIDRPCPLDPDIRRQVGIGAAYPRPGITLRGTVEMHDLAGRMDTGIGTSGAHRPQFMVGNPCQRLFQTPLHGPAGALLLPATEIRTIEFNTQGYPHVDCRCRDRSLIETARIRRCC